MAKQRDVTALDTLGGFNDSGYVMVVQDSELYGLPKNTLAEEIHNSLQVTSDIGVYSDLGLDVPVSVPSSDAKTVQTLTFATAGIYLIDADIVFGSNNSGIRVCEISQTVDNIAMTRSTVTAMPVNDLDTAVSLQTIINATTGESYYVNVRQTSGVSLDVNSRCRIVKIANPNA